MACGSRAVALVLGLEPQPLVLVPERGHRHDVAPPELVAGTSRWRRYLLFGALVAVEHQPGGVAPPLRDVRTVGAVGLNAISETSTEALDVLTFTGEVFGFTCL